MRALCCVALVSLIGCAPTPGYDYVITVDTKLSPAYVEALWNAVDSWQTMLDNKLNITYNYTGECQGDAGEICVYASSHDAIVAMGSSEGAVGLTIAYPSGHHDVFIPVKEDSQSSPEVKQMIVAHELTHGMGCEGHITPHNLMCWEEGCANPTPTCEDVAFFMAQRVNSPWGWQGNRSCPNGASFTITGK